MTIGMGIFLSTLLLILVFAIRQATRYQKWRLIGKIAAVVVIVCVAIGALAYAWVSISNLPPGPSRVTELAGVKLGMKPADVTLALGKPDASEDPMSEGKEITTGYIYNSPSRTIVFFGPDKYHLTANIICTGDYGAKLLGFDIGSKKADIIKRLGEPDEISVSRDGLSEYISYFKWNAAFQLAQGMLTQDCVSTRGVRFGEELLSPEEQKKADEQAARAKAEQEAQEAKLKAEEQAARAEEQRRAAAAAKTNEFAQARLRAAAESDTQGLIQSKPDPCAPNLSQAERLRRLAAFGQLRQTADGDYEAGGHSVMYSFGTLLACR